MDLACGGLRRRAAGDRPGAAFVLANREEGNITEQVVAGADHAVEARLFQTEIGEKRRRIGGVELSDLELDLPAYSHGRRRRSVQERREARLIRGASDTDGRVAPIGQLRLVDVDHDQERLRRKKLKAAEPLEIVAFEVQRTERPAVFECLAANREDVALAFELRRAGFPEVALEAFEPPLGDAKVREDQLVFHRLGVACGIDRAGRMWNGRILKRAEHVDEGVGVLIGDDVHECFCAAGSARRREVGELDGRGHAFSRVVHRRQAIQPRVGHFGDADCRLALAVDRAGGFPHARHQLKQRRLPARRESYEGRPKHVETAMLARKVGVRSESARSRLRLNPDSTPTSRTTVQEGDERAKI